MKQTIFLILFFLSITLNAYVVGTGKVVYEYSIYHEPTPPSYYEGKVIGKTLITYGTDGYYEQKISNTYTLEVCVAGGKELNAATSSSNYSENSIYIIVIWSNGGKSTIKVDNLSSNTGIINQTDITTSGEYFFKGYDDENRLFEISLISFAN